MSIEFDFDPGRNRLAIRGDFTIYHAQETIKQFRGREGIEVDLEGVTEMDGSGLQMVLAAHRDTGARLVAASDPVIGILRLAGLTELLEAAP